MEVGYYRKRPIKWKKYEVDLFTPNLFFKAEGCGANTLALLTGIPPFKIINTNRSRPDDWKDAFMVKFLKERGFYVMPLTQCDVSNQNSNYISDSITDKHIIMCSQLMAKNVASWAVFHNQLWYHNFQISSLNPTTLINSPILTGYIIWHPKLKSENWY